MINYLLESLTVGIDISPIVRLNGREFKLSFVEEEQEARSVTVDTAISPRARTFFIKEI